MMRIFLLFVMGLAFTITVDGAEPGHEPAAGPARRAKEQLPHWGYSGESGPTRWGELHPAYAACASGRAQTPVELGDLSSEPASTLRFDYRNSELRVVNNGHTIQANMDIGSVIALDGKKYILAQVHFHAPSEHTVNGQHYDMEAHLVHINLNRELAVVGVFLKRGRASPALEKLWRYVPIEVNKPVQAREESINGLEFLPAKRAYYRYQGSLTTPPCSEGVSWVVIEEPIEMSAEQIEKFSTIVGKNARPVQPLNGRRPLAGRSP
jgi:carbonic anhydrase